MPTVAEACGSSLMIVPCAVARPIAQLQEPDSVTLKVSLGSVVVSPSTLTEMVFNVGVTPPEGGLNVTVPDAPAKSLPTLAKPLPEPLTPTLYVTLTVVVAGCDSVTGNRNERVPLSPSMIEASPTLAVEVKDAWCMASVCAPPAET